MINTPMFDMIPIGLLEHRCLDVVTSDIDDGGEVENNIRYNFELNGIVWRLQFVFSLMLTHRSALG